MQTVTTLVSHEPRQVNGKNGTFTVHKFKDSSGTYFETTKQHIADQAYGLLNQQVTVDYFDKQNGQYTNHILDGIVAGAQAGASTGAPTGGSPTGAAPTQTNPGFGGDQSEFRRSKEEMRRTEALGHALKIAEGGLVTIATSSDLFKLADYVGTYLEFGMKAAPPAAGGETPAPAQAKATAPEPAAEPSVPAPDDDIPF